MLYSLDQFGFHPYLFGCFASEGLMLLLKVFSFPNYPLNENITEKLKLAIGFRFVFEVNFSVKIFR